LFFFFPHQRRRQRQRIRKKRERETEKKTLTSTGISSIKPDGRPTMVSSLAWMASMRPGLPASAAALPVFD